MNFLFSFFFFFFFYYLAKKPNALWLRTRKHLDVCPRDILRPTKYFSNFLSLEFTISHPPTSTYFGLFDASVFGGRPYVIPKNVSKMGDGRHISLVKDWTCLAKNFRQSGLWENYLGDDGVSGPIFSWVGRERILQLIAANWDVIFDYLVPIYLGFFANLSAVHSNILVECHITIFFEKYYWNWHGYK